MKLIYLVYETACIKEATINKTMRVHTVHIYTFNIDLHFFMHIQFTHPQWTDALIAVYFARRRHSVNKLVNYCARW